MRECAGSMASPITELYGRLVNLDVAPGFSAVAPVVASNPLGPLTGQRYPDSLIRPDKQRFRAAHRNRMAAAFRLFIGDSRRIWRLLQHVGLSNDCHPDGAATAAIEDLERCKTARPIRLRWQTDLTPLPLSRRTRSPSIRISASAMPKTGSYRCSATCRARCK